MKKLSLAFIILVCHFSYSMDWALGTVVENPGASMTTALAGVPVAVYLAHRAAHGLLVQTPPGGTRNPITFCQCDAQVAYPEIKRRDLRTITQVPEKSKLWVGQRYWAVGKDVYPHSSVCIYLKGLPISGLLKDIFLCRSIEPSVARDIAWSLRHKAVPENTSVVAFDYNDAPALANWGQADDCAAADEIVKLLHPRKEVTSLSFRTLCRGATTALNLLSQGRMPAGKVKGMVLESPITSVKELMERMEESSGIPYLSSIWRFLINRNCPRFDWADDGKLIERLRTMPDNKIPLFFGHIQGDKLVPDDAVAKMVAAAKLRSSADVYLLVLDAPHLDHAFMGLSEPFIGCMHAFYKAHGIGYNAELARKYNDLLAIAAANASKEHASQWVVTTDERFQKPRK